MAELAIIIGFVICIAAALFLSFSSSPKNH